MKYHNLYLVGFVLTAIFIVSQIYLFIPVSDILISTYHRTESDISLLTSYFGFSYAGGFLLWGPLSDKFGRKTIMLLGMLLVTIVTCGLAFFNMDFQTALILRIVQGFTAASFPPVALAFISDFFPNDQKIKGIAWMSAAFLLSALVGQWIGNAFISDSIRNVMLLFTACYAIAFLFNLLLPKSSESAGTQSRKTAPLINSIVNTLANLNLLRLYVIALSLLGSLVALYTLLSSSKSHLLPEGVSVSELRLYGIPCMFAPLFIGIAIRKIGADKTVVLTIIAAAISIYLQSVTKNTAAFIFFHMVFVASIAGSVPSVISLVASKSNPESRGFAVSIYTFTLFVGASLGALLPVHFGNNTIYISVVLLSVSVLLNLPTSTRTEKVTA